VPDRVEATSDAANALVVRERVAQSLKPEMARMGVKDATNF
jgi:hypothetical protein